MLKEPKPPKENKSDALLVRMKPSEKAIFESRAKELGLSLAEFFLGSARYSVGFPEDRQLPTNLGNFATAAQPFPFFAYMSRPRTEDLPPRKPFQPIPRHLLTPT